MSQISLTGIRKSFGSTEVLKGVSLDIQAGEFVTLVGPSGCGKSTLLRILAGLETADGGSVSITGRDVTTIRPAERDLAMVFQSYALYPHLTVAENMMTPLKMRGLRPVQRLPILGPLLSAPAHREMRGTVQEVAQTLQITQLLDRKPGQLSGGQRQRVALGRAMVRDPAAFLMDEPLSNLDAALRVHMRAELSELHRRLRATFVYVTHDQAEALTMSDRMAVMMDGHILQVGPPDEVYANPANLQVAKFIGSPSINVLAGELDPRGAVQVLGGAVVLPGRAAPGPVSVGIRPEHAKLAITGPFSGVVRHRENLGSDIFFHLDIAGHDSAFVLRATPHEARGVALNDTVAFDLETAQALLFDGDGQRIYLQAVSSEAVA